MNSKIVNVIKKGELIFLWEKETKKSLLLITFGVVLFALLMHFSEVIKILQRGVSLTLPIMVGLILAFVLNVPMKMFERLFAKLKKKYPQLKKIPVTSLSFICNISVHRPFNRNRVYDVRARTCCLGKKHLQCFYGKYAKVVILAAK